MQNIIRPKAFTHKDEMRIIEHGQEWELVRGPETVLFQTNPHILLRSVKTGYLRWWPLAAAMSEACG